MNLASLSQQWAAKMVERSGSQESVAVVAFGLHLFLQLMIKGILLLLWLLIIDRPMIALLIVFMIGMTRAVMGGVHAKSFGKCTIWTSGVVCLTYALSLTFEEMYAWSPFALIGISIAAVVFLIGFTYGQVPIRWGARIYSAGKVLISKSLAFVMVGCIGLFLAWAMVNGTYLGEAAAILLSITFNALMNLRPIRDWITE